MDASLSSGGLVTSPALAGEANTLQILRTQTFQPTTHRITVPQTFKYQYMAATGGVGDGPPRNILLIRVAPWVDLSIDLLLLKQNTFPHF